MSSTLMINEAAVVFRPITDPVPTVEILLAWDRHTLNPLVSVLVDVAHTTTSPYALRSSPQRHLGHRTGRR